MFIRACIRSCVAAILIPAAVAFGADGPKPGAKGLRAGAAAVDVSPTTFPVLVNGGFLEAKATAVRDPLASRALVLDDGATRIAIVVVDSCMMPRDLIDRAKALATGKTGIPADRILISATHTHTAPAAMWALGCAPDLAYVDLLPPAIARSIARANANLEPAEIGRGAIDDPDHTHCRRWIRRPDKLVVDPFGRATGRAHMHPGYLNPDAIAPSGPVDPQLSVVAVRATDGRPIALLANYSMHYFGASPVSADYFGKFAALMPGLVGAKEGDGPPFVAMMSQGTSGDQHWMDYGRAKTDQTLDRYAEEVARNAAAVHRGIAEYRRDISVAMAETTLTLGRRVPDPARLAWAKPILEAMGDRPPRSLPEVYAREAKALHEDPVRTLKVQAIRLGDLAIAAIPNEVYALTGLKIKARSPVASTFTIELANGSEGYIPPPEQHVLGGYTTWPARTAALEVGAEPRIVETVLGLLEAVSGRPRRREASAPTAAADAIAAAGPWGFWRLDEMDGRLARDATGRGRDARLEDGYALYLEGADGASRAVHLAGGRLVLPPVGLDVSRGFVLSFSFWNGLPADAREVCGTLVDVGGGAIRVEIGGRSGATGRLRLTAGGATSEGKGTVEPKRWHRLTIASDGARVTVRLDGAEDAAVGAAPVTAGVSVALGGADDPSTRFEGKLDEVALFDRAPDAELLGRAEGRAR